MMVGNSQPSGLVRLLPLVAGRVAATAKLNARASRTWKFAGLAGVALTGASRALPQAKAGEFAWATLVLFAGVLLALTAGLFVLILDRDRDSDLALAAEALAEIEPLRDGLAEALAQAAAAEDIAYRQATLTALATTFRDVVEEMLNNGPGPAEARSGRLGRVLDLLASNRSGLFGMTDERWNFAIYLHDGAANTLTCAACRRPTRDASDAPHRDIAPGTGHVGKVFLGEREAVAHDATLPMYLQMFEMTVAQGGKPDDAIIYRSIASVPIGPRAGPPIGVLVATSDIPGRFTPRAADAELSGFDTVEPLRICAATLAILLRATTLFDTV